MKVILQKAVPNLGDAGEVKEVANGYATNYLIPRKMVVPFTASSRKQLLHQQRLIKLKSDKALAEMKTLHDKIQGLSLSMEAKVGRKGKLFGSVTTADISKQLAAQDIQIEKRKLELNRPIKEVGKYKVTIRLAQGLMTEVPLEVTADEASMAELEKLQEEEEARAADKKAQEAANMDKVGDDGGDKKPAEAKATEDAEASAETEPDQATAEAATEEGEES